MLERQRQGCPVQIGPDVAAADAVLVLEAREAVGGRPERFRLLISVRAERSLSSACSARSGHAPGFGGRNSCWA